MAQATWRPTGTSMRNLIWFWSALAVCAGATASVRSPSSDRNVLFAVFAMAAVGGAAVAYVWNRGRVERALTAAVTPKLNNWPPTATQESAAAAAAIADARRAVALGAVAGVVAGFVPIVGAGVAAAGIAGALGTSIVRSAVVRYERANDAIVLTAGREGRTRDAGLVLGIAPRPTRSR